ncbi:MAG TPA: sugar phosphate nucleotidyltransferase [Dehalococcoidales bacterium]|nr:sugar phosphate nucleotidyltransferase [Dehalococcoidales bacterium]
MNTAAVILAGGRGERMGVLCHSRPKPSLPFAGKYRVIDFSLSNCLYSGLSNIAVLTDYNRALLADYVNHWRGTNAPDANLRTLEPKNGSYNGTADAVFQCLPSFGKNRTDTFLILAADHVYRMDYRRMLAFHRDSKADITLGIIPVSEEQARRFGTVNLGMDDRITDFYEKSCASPSRLASMGVYIFNRDVLEQCLADDSANPASQHDFGYSVLPQAVKDRRVFAYMFGGYWRDIGTIDTYYETNLDLNRAGSRLSMDGESPVLTHEKLSIQSCMGKEAGVTGSVISPGCVVRGRVENSVLSPRVWVDEGAFVRDSIIMGNVFIGRDSVVDGAILDEWVKVGSHSYIGLGHVPGGINEIVTVLGPGVTVPPDTIMERKHKVQLENVPRPVAGSVVEPPASIFNQPVTGLVQDGEVSPVEV